MSPFRDFLASHCETVGQKRPCKMALVVPTNRPERLHEFFYAWEGKGGWDTTIIVEDNPNITSGVLDVDYHFCHESIAAILGEDSWIISQKDSACRCFGFLAAWHLGAEYVLTMDDDCYPLDGTADFFDEHICRCIYDHPRWISTVPGLRVRGLPYKNTGTLNTVMANMGLWMGHPDLDALCQLDLLGEQVRPAYCLPSNNCIIPAGQYVPVCGMNLCIKREALPCFYFPLMGQDQPYSRFDDIWSGIIAKKVFDHLGWHLSVGEPFVDHRRASDPFKNLVKEAPGIEANETFWEVIDRILINTGASSATAAIRHIGTGLMLDYPPETYLGNLGGALYAWSEIFDGGS